MRITKKLLEARIERAQDCGLDVSLGCQCGTYSVESYDGSRRYDYGLTAREAYYLVNGMILGKAPANHKIIVDSMSQTSYSK